MIEARLALPLRLRVDDLGTLVFFGLLTGSSPSGF